ncbi:MAG: polysaccharide biosynthesis/export family protein [Rhizobiales bacterium]|nr:polysaccharide biosynthesis/export family protein [Hyphomicrobiales bacterium]NRB15719.1 polysaccharide biosynthesis/export family protein [Hyphomicrobiales bacterium]
MRLFKLSIVLCLGLVVSSCALVPGGDIFLSDIDRKASQETPSITTDEIEFHKITSANTKRKAVKKREPFRNVKLEQQVRDYVYKVGAGDVLKVVVWEHPELLNLGTKDAAIPVSGFEVDEQGNIFYPFVGLLNVVGKSTYEIREILNIALSEYIENPQMAVTVIRFASKKIYLTGQIVKPLPLVMQKQAITLLDAVNLAGGVRPNADLDDIVVIRNGNRRHIDLYALMHYGDMRENILLADGDQIHIASQKPKFVQVLGQVAVPMMVPISPEGLNLAEALGAARGINESSADASAVYVVRESFKKGKIAKVYMLDLSNMVAMVLAAKFELQNEDMVYIAKAPIVKWNQFLSIISPSLVVPGAVNSAKDSAVSIFN